MKTVIQKAAVKSLGILLALGTIAPTASASLCQATSTSWTQTLTCGGGRGEAWGSGSGSSKAIGAWTKWGNSSVTTHALGRTSSGSLISGCKISDTVDDEFLLGNADISGCGSAAKFTIQVNY
jgi:hypothetical protein